VSYVPNSKLPTSIVSNFYSISNSICLRLARINSAAPARIVSIFDVEKGVPFSLQWTGCVNGYKGGCHFAPLAG
jgi:hypothetical protein